MVVLLAPHLRKNSRSFRAIARRCQSLALTLLTHHILSISSGKECFFEQFSWFFCRRACKCAGSLGWLWSQARWSDISQGGDQEITPLVHDGTSQFLLSGYQQCWISSVNYRGRWDLLRKSNCLVWMKRMMARNLWWVMTLDTEIFLAFHPKPSEMLGLGLPLKVFLFPSIFKKKGSQALVLTGRGSNSLSFVRGLWAKISDPVYTVHVLRGKGRTSCDGSEKAYIHFNRAGTVLLKGKNPKQIKETLISYSACDHAEKTASQKHKEQNSKIY